MKLRRRKLFTILGTVTASKLIATENELSPEPQSGGFPFTCISKIKGIEDELTKKRLSITEFSGGADGAKSLFAKTELEILKANHFNDSQRHFQLGIWCMYFAKLLQKAKMDASKLKGRAQEELSAAAKAKHPTSMYLQHTCNIYTEEGRRQLVLAAFAGSIDAFAELSGRDTLPDQDWFARGPVSHYVASESEAFALWMTIFYVQLIKDPCSKRIKICYPNAGTWDSVFNPELKPDTGNWGGVIKLLEDSRLNATRVCANYTIEDVFLGDIYRIIQ